jgi:hypothetical protein
MISTSLRSDNVFDIGPEGTGGESRGIVTSKAGNAGDSGARAEYAKLAGSTSPQLFLELVVPVNEPTKLERAVPIDPWTEERRRSRSVSGDGGP